MDTVGGFIVVMDKMFGPIIRNTIQIPGIIDSIEKGKNIQKVLSNAIIIKLL